MSPLLLDQPGARVLLAGSSSHRDNARLPSVPAVKSGVLGLANALTRHAGLPANRLTVLLDPESPHELAEAIARLAEQSEELLVFAYAGHGLIGADNQLYLATRASVDLMRGVARNQALPYAEVRTILSSSPAPHALVLLDCCWAGRATSWPGCYLLTATSRDEVAWVPHGDENPAFTGALIELLTAGDPQAPRLLTLDDVHRSLRRTLGARDLPLPRRQAADVSGGRPLAINAAYRAPEGRPFPVDRGPGDDTQDCPYRGLAAYGVEDNVFFFGRDHLVDVLVSRAAESERGPLLVTGPSGSGKSSVLRAGLLAAFAPRPYIVMTPGSDPLGTFERCLSDFNSTRTAKSQSLPADLVIVVDQFEELFVLCERENQREAFIEALTTAAERYLVVLGLRADFFGHCTPYPALVAALEHAVIVPPLMAAQLREVIEKPAELAGLALDDGLADLLLEDVGTDTSTTPLPLLSHALLATWQRREGQVLTLGGYRAAGGIAQALARTADSTLHALSPTDQEAARRMLVRLVHLGEATDTSRRTVPLLDVLSIAETPGAGNPRAILETFTRARLLTVDEDRVQIIHEALIRAWPRLRLWLDTDRAGLLVEQHLTEAALRWDRGGRDPGELYQTGRLALARYLAEPSHRANLSQVAADFIDASVEHEAAQQRAVRLRVRRRNMLLVVLATLLLSTVLAGGVALSQWRSAETSLRLAEEQRDIAVGRDFMARSELLRERQGTTSLRLGVAGLALDPDNEGTRAGLASMLFTTPPHTTLVEDDDSRATSFVLSGNGDYALSTSEHYFVSQDGAGTSAGVQGTDVVLWDLKDPAAPRQRVLLPGDNSIDYSVRLSADGRRAMTSSVPSAFSGTPPADLVGIVELWDLTDPDVPRRWTLPLPRNKDVSYDAVLSADGRRALILEDSFARTGCMTKRVTYWDLTDPAHPRSSALRMGLRSGWVYSAEVSADGRRALVSGRMCGSDNAEETVALWDLSDLAAPQSWPLSLPSRKGDSYGLALSADGRRALISFDNVAKKAAGGVSLWDLAVPSAPRSWPLPLPKRKGVTFDTALSANGMRALVGPPLDSTRQTRITSAENAVTVWDITDPGLPRPDRLPLPVGEEIAAFEISGDGQHALIATSKGALGTSFRGTTMLWTLLYRTTPEAIPIAAGTVVNDVALSEDGKRALVADYSTSRSGVVVWGASADSTPKPTALPLPSSPERRYAAALSANGRYGLIADNDLANEHLTGSVFFWDFAGPGEPRSWKVPISGRKGTAYEVALSADGSHALVADRSATYSLDFRGTVTLWDLRDPSKPKSMPLPLPSRPDTTYEVALSEDGGRALTADQSSSKSLSRSGEVTAWDFRDWRDVKAKTLPLPMKNDTTYSLALSSDGRRAMTAGRSSQEGDSDEVNVVQDLRYWDLADFSAPLFYSLPIAADTYAYDLSLSRDGRLALTNKVTYVTEKIEKLTFTLPHMAVVFWDMSSPENPVAHTWDLASKRISPIAFSGDGRVAATSLRKNELVRWDLGFLNEVADDPARAACAIVARGLNAQEWRGFVSGFGPPHRETCPG
ncbi:caspase, EACC1-associated type [Nonomuraea insulae]|uniref:Caspase family protein n=1 Tax=Nonomuraea insulae TaxID=1616787 RepID=A0ABW1D7I0_9ACTN